MCVCMGVCLGRGDNMKKKKKKNPFFTTSMTKNIQVAEEKGYIDVAKMWAWKQKKREIQFGV